VGYVFVPYFVCAGKFLLRAVFLNSLLIPCCKLLSTNESLNPVNPDSDNLLLIATQNFA
jgi:hypothetical protein